MPRIPKEPFIIYCDSREQAPPPFPEGCLLQRVTMSEGDYTSPACQGIGVIERKSVRDFASSIAQGRERLDDEVRRLRDYRWKCIVIEGEILDVPRMAMIHPHAVLGTVASFWARSDLPCLFAGNPAGAGRLMAGILRRWAERLAGEQSECEARGSAVRADPVSE